MPTLGVLLPRERTERGGPCETWVGGSWARRVRNITYGIWMPPLLDIDSGLERTLTAGPRPMGLGVDVA